MLSDEPLPVTTSVRMWTQGEGARVAQSLVHDLLLLKDVQFFSDGSKDSIVRRLQWHTIAVISSHSTSHLLYCMNDFPPLLLFYFYFLHTPEFVIVVLLGYVDYSHAR